MAHDVLFFDNNDDELVFVTDDLPVLDISQDFSASFSAKENTADELKTPVWKVLIVDDEIGIHDVTKYALHKVYFEGKPLQFISAYSGEEAKQLTRQHPDLALILLDVVMEHDDSGLHVAEYIRKVLKNKLVRIVLRTGQAGDAPEDAIIMEYEINDYKTKTELTRQRLFSTVIAALRSYRDVTTIETHRKELSKLNRELEKANVTLEDRILARTQRLEMVATLGQRLNAILDVDQVLIELVNQVQASFGYTYVHVYLLTKDGHLTMVQGVGQVTLPQGYKISLLISKSLVAQAARTGEVVALDNIVRTDLERPKSMFPTTHAEMAVPIIQGDQVVGVLDVQQSETTGLDEGDTSLLRSLANQVAIALKNAQLYSVVQQANQELAQLNADKDKFFSIVAHDLKGPFLPLLEKSKKLSDMAGRWPPNRIKETSQLLHSSAEVVFNLLETLLQWSRLQMGYFEYHPGRIDVTEVINQNITLLSINATNKKLKVTNQIQRPVFVYADEQMLNTIIRNLISNALKFTPIAGTIIITGAVKEKTSLKQQTYLEVAISDTGIGFDAAKLKTLGQNRSTLGTAQETGTGLGLVMCKEMVTLNGGEIRVDSQKEIGTTFYFTVPLDEVPTGSWLDSIIDDDEPIVDQETKFVVPGPIEMSILLELARRGNMRRIKQWADQIEKQDEAYKPFADELRDLAGGFQGKAILALVELYIVSID